MANISFDITGKGNMESLRAFVEYDKEQRQKTLVEVVNLAQQSSVPWSSDLIERLFYMSQDHFEDAMEHHSGHKLYNAHQSVRFFLKLFNVACEELEGAIEHYHQSVKDPEFFSHKDRTKHDHVVFVINQRVFNVSSAADALKNFSIKQESHYAPEDYASKKRQCFAENGVHQFIQKLRVALHHEHFIMGSPTITRTSNDTHETQLCLYSRKLLKLKQIRENKQSREFVESNGEKIDIGDVFVQYAETVNGFHEWLLECMGNSPEYVDYERCLRERRNQGSRVSYSILLQAWIDKGLNPYDYLDKYLKAEQLGVVNDLPHGSKEQVDKIIELLDKDKACNNQVREKVYRLFKVVV